jgi:hypothetical protein
VVTLLDKGALGSPPDTGPPRAAGFEEFYGACFQSVTIQLFAYTSDMAAAQDVVQEAFCRALARWKRVSVMDDPAAGVRRVAWNLATSRRQVTSFAALAWHGFRYAPKSEHVQMLVPHHTRRKSAGHVIVARTIELDVHARDAGLYRVCSPARAVVDAGRELQDVRTIRAFTAEAVQRGFTDLAALVEEVTRAKRSRTALIRRVVDEVLAGVRSAPEAELRECLAGSPLHSLLRWNPQLHRPDGTRLPTPDAWIPYSAVAIEVDSKEFHYSVDGWRRTMDRHNELGRVGVLVLHFTPADIRSDAARVRRIIEQTHESRLERVTCDVLTRDPSYAETVNKGPFLAPT